MDEMWRTIPAYPMYSISSFGRVRNDYRKRVMTLSQTRQGAVKVGLVGDDGIQHTHSVKVLVADNFLPGKTETFNTAIHLDNDQTNNRVDNLEWRPRWFAWKYTRQMDFIYPAFEVGPIRNRNTGLLYENIIDAALSNGCLFRDISLSLMNNTPVFPTWHIYDWVRTQDS